MGFPSPPTYTALTSTALKASRLLKWVEDWCFWCCLRSVTSRSDVTRRCHSSPPCPVIGSLPTSHGPRSRAGTPSAVLHPQWRHLAVPSGHKAQPRGAAAVPAPRKTQCLSPRHSQGHRGHTTSKHVVTWRWAPRDTEVAQTPQPPAGRQAQQGVPGLESSDSLQTETPAVQAGTS